MDERAKSKSATVRNFNCRYCGGSHRRKSKEARECRQRYRDGKPAAESAPVREAGERHAGSPMTHYQAKPKSWALAAKKLRKSGWADAKIAKRLGINVAEIAEVIGRRDAP